MFYGWGQDTAEYPMPDGRTAICSYKYLSVMFIFKFARSKRWFVEDRARSISGALAAPDGQQVERQAPVEVSREELDAMFSPEPAPNLNLWQRFGIVVPIIGFVAFFGIVAFLARGTTSAGALEVGDCFIETADEEFSSLTTPACTEVHDAQIFAAFELVDSPEEAPTAADPFWDKVFDRCLDEAENLVNPETLPDNVELRQIGPDDRGWERGDREIMCYLYSPTGLTGSYVSATN